MKPTPSMSDAEVIERDAPLDLPEGAIDERLEFVG